MLIVLSCMLHSKNDCTMSKEESVGVFNEGGASNKQKMFQAIETIDESNAHLCSNAKTI